ncbi:hypothetical protein C8R44DRAFT_737012 [Mycena epipterygia]|nr:hypothetical protein C8R44DRAFT_737012 [Mycena epipterygia]
MGFQPRQTGTSNRPGNPSAPDLNLPAPAETTDVMATEASLASSEEPDTRKYSVPAIKHRQRCRPQNRRPANRNQRPLRLLRHPHPELQHDERRDNLRAEALRSGVEHRRQRRCHCRGGDGTHRESMDEVRLQDTFTRIRLDHVCLAERLSVGDIEEQETYLQSVRERAPAQPLAQAHLAGGGSRERQAMRTSGSDSSESEEVPAVRSSVGDPAGAVDMVYAGRPFKKRVADSMLSVPNVRDTGPGVGLTRVC